MTHSRKILPTSYPKVFPICKVDIISQSSKINDLQDNVWDYHRHPREIKNQENNTILVKPKFQPLGVTKLSTCEQIVEA